MQTNQGIIAVSRLTDNVVGPAEWYSRAETSYEHGALTDAYQEFLNARAGFEKQGNKTNLLDVMLMLGRVSRDLGDFQEALAFLEEAASQAQSTEDTNAAIDALNLKASVLSALGENRQSLACLNTALEKSRAVGSELQAANILTNIGLLHSEAASHHEALSCLTKAYAILYKVAPASREAAINLTGLGHLYLDLGDPDSAERFYKKARDVGLKIENRIIEATALNNLALVYQSQEQWASAKALFEAALDISNQIGLKRYQIDNLDGLGRAYTALGDYRQALIAHKRALDVAIEIGDSEGKKDAFINLGRGYLKKGVPERAHKYLLSGLELAIGLEHQRSVFEVHELLAETYKLQGNFAKALEHYEAFHRTEKQVFNQDSEEKTRQLTVKFDLERARIEADEYKLRSTIAQQAKQKAEETVSLRTQELEGAQLEIVERLAVASEYRDDDTGEHTRRVGRNAAAIALHLGWPQDEVQLLYMAARMHDIGKIGIKDGILLKPGKLSNDEFELMRTHTTIGARILSQGKSRLLQLAEEIALSHHERWDGKGYPYGLTGTDIPLSARIVSVADVLDALTHERPYKHAWSVEETLAEIEGQAGSQFDPQVVEACLLIFGHDGYLSPLEAPADWLSTEEELSRITTGGPNTQAENSISEDLAPHS